MEARYGAHLTLIHLLSNQIHFRCCQFGKAFLQMLAKIDHNLSKYCSDSMAHFYSFVL